jgi:hypothetical protein
VGTALSVIRVDGAAIASSTRRTPTILMIVGLSKNSKKRMESPSTVGVAVATARAVPEVTTATTTGMKVAGATTRRAQIPSLYRYLHQQTITEKKTRGATKSHEASHLASWEELKLRYQIATSSSCRGRLRQHNQA